MSVPDPQNENDINFLEKILQAAEGLHPVFRFVVVFGVLLVFLFIVGSNIPDNLVPLLYILLIGGMVLYIWAEYQISQREKNKLDHDEAIAKIGRDTPLSGSETNVIVEPPSVPDPSDLSRQYLHKLFVNCGSLSMAMIDPRAQHSHAAQIALQTVFTKLDVADTRRQNDPEAMARKGRDNEESREAALSALSRHKHLVLLGQPGSGKSTLVNFITYCLAGEGLGHETINARLLNDMDWNLPSLLPIRVILRDYAARGLPEKQSIWAFLAGELADADLAAYQPVLKSHLEKRGGLLLLDGLDEVPEAHQRREQLREAILAFVRDFPQVRVVVTSRPYAYDADWYLPDFTRADLLDFNEEQIHHYIDSWYAVTGELDPDLPAKRAEQYAEQLKREIKSNTNLADLAPRPLLLALMVSLHRWHHGGGLPEKREELYDQSVDLLLDLWQRPKQLFDNHGRPIEQETSALVELGIGRDSLRTALSQVAFEAHRDQPELVGTADISGGKLAQVLYEAPGRKEGVDYDRIIQYVEHRAGLLEERGKDRTGRGIYTFPHRTFQEYLAACYLLELETFPTELVELARQDPTRWREAVLLAAGRANAQAMVWTLVQALCPKPLRDDLTKVTEAEWWGAYLAARVLWDVGLFATKAEQWQTVLDNLQSWLVAIVAQAVLPPLDRAGASEVLDRLGYLPPDLHRWRHCAGCGEDGADLWVMQYLVTNAHFALFMQAGGYAEKAYWQAGEFGRWQEPDYWDDVRFGQTRRGCPVVGVSWYEANAYAAWVTALLKRAQAKDPSLTVAEKEVVAGLLAAGVAEVRLPTDEEWTKIAGGEANDRYPWDVDGETTRVVSRIMERANTAELGWGRTTPIYQYPLGASVPHQVWDLAGNVWEWMLSERGGGRGWRGGSWYGNRNLARVSNRNLDLPDYRGYYFGFRVVAPVLSGS